MAQNTRKNIVVTITGADDIVDHDDMLKLCEEFPFLEWGILVSFDRAGTARYPSVPWLIELSRRVGFHDPRLHAYPINLTRAGHGAPI
jgi:hypothetical protein